MTEQRHSAMLEDVRRMLAIRREHSDLIYAPAPGEQDIKMNSVPSRSKDDLPVPYVLSNGKRALLIVGNPSADEVTVELELTIANLNLPTETKPLKVTELWPAEKTSQNMSVRELSAYKCTVSADHKAGGGLNVIRFELIP